MQIAADGRVLDRHPREFLLALGEEADLVLGRDLFHDHGREAVAAVLLDLVRDVGQRDLQDPRQPAELRVLAALGKVGGRDLDRGRARVVDEQAAVTVLHRTAQRLFRLEPELVVLRRYEELVPGEHLERPEAHEEDAERGEDEETEDPDPEQELRREPVGRVDARVAGQEAPRPDRHRAASQRTPPPAGAEQA